MGGLTKKGLADNRPIHRAAYNEVSAKKSLFNNGTTDRSSQSEKSPEISVGGFYVN